MSSRSEDLEQNKEDLGGVLVNCPPNEVPGDVKIERKEWNIVKPSRSWQYFFTDMKARVVRLTYYNGHIDCYIEFNYEITSSGYELEDTPKNDVFKFFDSSAKEMAYLPYMFDLQCSYRKHLVTKRLYVDKEIFDQVEKVVRPFKHFYTLKC
jgi:hypothetical protein